MPQLNRFTDNWKTPELMHYPIMPEILSPDKKWIVLGDSSSQTSNYKVTFYRRILALDGSGMHTITLVRPSRSLHWNSDSKGLTYAESLPVFVGKRQMSSKPYLLNITFDSLGIHLDRVALRQNDSATAALENSAFLANGESVQIKYLSTNSSAEEGAVVSRAHPNEREKPFDVQTLKFPDKTYTDELESAIGTKGILWEARDTGKSDLPFIGEEVTKWRRMLTQKATQSFWFSEFGAKQMKQLGRNKLAASEVEEKFIRGITWLPDGKNVSFQRGDTLYVLPVK